MNELVRLDKYIASAAGVSRKEATLMIRKGRAAVNGEPVRTGEQKVDPAADAVTLDGAPLGFERHVYYMMNKPSGVVCATEDREERTVLDLLPEGFRRAGVFPAGRLDKDTTGLLILTDDGDFAHRMLSPRRHVTKRYEAHLDRAPDPDADQRFAQGLELSSGERFAPARLEMTGERDAVAEIGEGRYHQVKRMFAACGAKVESLRRVGIGALRLDDSLEEGEVRPLTGDELRLVFADPEGDERA